MVILRKIPQNYLFSIFGIKLSININKNVDINNNINDKLIVCIIKPPYNLFNKTYCTACNRTIFDYCRRSYRFNDGCERRRVGGIGNIAC